MYSPVFNGLTGPPVLWRGLSVGGGGTDDRLLVSGALIGLDLTDCDGNSTSPRTAW